MESSWKEASALRRVRLALIFQRSTSLKHNRRNYKKYWRNWCSIQHSCWFVPIKAKIALDLSLSAGNRGLYRDRGILKECNFIYEDHAWRSLGDLLRNPLSPNRARTPKLDSAGVGFTPDSISCVKPDQRTPDRGMTMTQ